MIYSSHFQEERCCLHWQSEVTAILVAFLTAFWNGHWVCEKVTNSFQRLYYWLNWTPVQWLGVMFPCPGLNLTFPDAWHMSGALRWPWETELSIAALLLTEEYMFCEVMSTICCPPPSLGHTVSTILLMLLYRWITYMNDLVSEKVLPKPITS